MTKIAPALRKRGWGIVLSMALALSLGTAPLAWAAEAQPSVPESAADTAQPTPPAKAATKISGLNRNIAKKPTATIKDAIKVSPAGKRTVRLQLYNSSTKKWKTRATFTTDSAGKVTLKYPGDWKKKNTTEYSSLGTKAIGDTTTVRNLLYMALLPSDNGAAEALAIHTAGSESAFVALMNARARELGCTHTSFKNPHGLTEKGHGSSARDLAKIAQEALGNPAFAKIVNTKSYAFTTAKGNRYTLKTTNKLLGKVKGVRGVKTGFTDAAGQCFVGAFKHKGKTYLTVVLGSPSSDQRWNDTKALIKYIKKYF